MKWVAWAALTSVGHHLATVFIAGVPFRYGEACWALATAILADMNSRGRT